MTGDTSNDSSIRSHRYHARADSHLSSVCASRGRGVSVWPDSRAAEGALDGKHGLGGGGRRVGRGREEQTAAPCRGVIPASPRDIGTAALLPTKGQLQMSHGAERSHTPPMAIGEMTSRSDLEKVRRKLDQKGEQTRSRGRYRLATAFGARYPPFHLYRLPIYGPGMT